MCKSKDAANIRAGTKRLRMNVNDNNVQGKG
jgi:hypothetical protein